MEKWPQFIHRTKVIFNKMAVLKIKIAHVYTTIVD